MKKQKVALVVGHSRQSQGATTFNGITEYAFNCLLGHRLATDINEGYPGQIEIFEKTEEDKWPELIKVLDDFGGVWVEMHFNRHESSYPCGVEALYWKDSRDSEYMAEKFCRIMSHITNFKNRGPKCPTNKRMTKKTKHPGIIAEPFFGGFEFQQVLHKQEEIYDGYLGFLTRIILGEL